MQGDLARVTEVRSARLRRGRSQAVPSLQTRRVHASPGLKKSQ